MGDEVETAKQTMDSAKERLDRAYSHVWDAGGGRQAQADHEHAAAVHRKTVEVYQNAKLDAELSAGKAVAAAKQAEREAARVQEIQSRSAAGQTALTEAARRDQLNGRRPGESAADWVAREKAESRAQFIPGKVGGQREATSPAALEALRREGMAEQKAAAQAAAAPKAKGRPKGW